MNDTEKSLWKSLDRAVFGTDDPDVILAKVELELKREARRKRTLYGYLKLLRERMGLNFQEMAMAANVSTEIWLSWESSLYRPTEEQLNSVIEELGLWGKNAKELRALL